MFERKIARDTLRLFGLQNVDKLDEARFIQRFKIDKMPLSKKLIAFVGLPAFRKFLDIKLEGVIDEDKT